MLDKTNSSAIPLAYIVLDGRTYLRLNLHVLPFAGIMVDISA
jgi:hypothetical protein